MGKLHFASSGTAILVSGAEVCFSARCAALISFVTPDLLGSVATFRRIFGEPIARSRDRDSSPEEVALGQQRSAELSRRVGAFVLRRTKGINAAYLPPLHSYVAFCPPSPLQVLLLQ